MKTNTKFHVGLNVSDIGASTVFYRDLLGSEPVKTKHNYAKFETDSIVLSLIAQPGRGTAFGHFGLRVDNAEILGEYRKRITDAHHQVLDEEATDCCYALQDKFWVSDPDGYRWEVYRFIRDTHDTIRGGSPAGSSETEAAACCEPACCTN